MQTYKKFVTALHMDWVPSACYIITEVCICMHLDIRGIVFQYVKIDSIIDFAHNFLKKTDGLYDMVIKPILL